MNTTLRTAIASVFILAAYAAAAQAPSEQELVGSFARVRYWSGTPEARSTAGAGDSLNKANDRFKSLLLRAAADITTLQLDYKPLQDAGVTIVTAPDGLFRIYSWDDGSGGTMRYHENVFQYAVNGRSFGRTGRRGEGDAGAWYTRLFSLPAAGHQYYLAVTSAQYSSKDAYAGVQSFEIANNRLNESVKLFRTATGLHNGLGFEYDFFSVVDRPERPLQLFGWNASDSVLSIPVVDTKGKVTKRFIRYRWNGTVFEKLQ